MPDDILRTALDQFQQSQSASGANRRDAIADIEFARLGEQWPAAIRRQRQLEGRPVLTINRLPSLIRQVVNDARQNKPAISVHPVDGGADYDTAEVIGGLLRAIERNSNAGVAYDTAIDHAVTGGFGFFRIEVDYAHPESFDMDARISRIANPLSVYWDTASMEVDASDWRYAFVSDFMPRTELQRKYPKAAPSSWDGGSGDQPPDWGDTEAVRVAEYWSRESDSQKIYGFEDGSVYSEALLIEAAKRMAMSLGYDQETVRSAPKALLLRELFSQTGRAPARERDAETHKVTRRVITANEILEETSWPGTTIPICPVWGEEIVVRGIRHFRGLIRDARDPQAMLNFWRSASTELVALAPRAPWLIDEDALPEGEELAKWLTANTRSHAYLTFRGRGAGGQMPSRVPFAGVPAGALQEALNASDDLKSVTGIFDAALGARGNETSGRAINARQRQSNTSTFHFIDNLSRAIQYCGRCLVEIVGGLYSQRQAIQILGPDMTPKVVQLAQGGGGALNPEGQPRLYDLSVGRYDVTVKTGPSYATQREEAANSLMELVRAYPAAAPVLGDLIVRNMDWPDADEAAKRIQMLQQMMLQQQGMLPPPGGPGPQGMPPAALPPG
ncbi:portal protein [Roseococcus pinisoli]|uniref:Portal protein n=1 Tax=Roseococcus pinisoli TaxID=2835040 RepID=A0ABS5QBZ7_9PROT|nr:portal protein [Roseococcus pinisoli]MBS7811204.1 hypothetical protein [Roseococcus pinisoli]